MAHSPKRAAMETGSDRPAKRLKVSSPGKQESATSPSVNYGLSDQFDLELFQKVFEERLNKLQANTTKEALYRSLQAFKRQSETATERLHTLQDKADALESVNHAVTAAWTGLVSSLRALFPEAAANLSFELPDFPAQDRLAAYQSSLKEHAYATLSLVQSLLNSSPSTSARGPELDSLSRQCADLTQQLVATRQALAMTSTQLAQAREHAEKSQQELQICQKALERAKSSTVAQLELRLTTDDRINAHTPSRLPSPKLEEGEVDKKATPPPEIAHKTKTNGNLPHLPINTTDDTALQEARILADSRASQISDLRSERTQLLNEIDDLTIQKVSKDQIILTPEYTQLKTELESAQTDLSTALEALETAREELQTITKGQNELKEIVIRDASYQSDDLNRRLLGKEADLNRIRAQREELKAENAELKAREAEKFRSVEAIRVLANSKEDRMTALKSEIRRLRMKLAANAGDQNGVDFQAANDQEMQVEILQKELDSSKALAGTLRERVVALSGAPTDLVDSEATARIEISNLRGQLAQHDATFGPASSRSDLKALGDRLSEREKHVLSLEANVKALEMSSGMLLSEIERLSLAWQQLETQNKDKLMNLVQNEERMTKLTTEKAKADNRYFAAMRAKEAIQAENQVLTKTLERHSKSIDVLAEARTASVEQQTSYEKEIASLNAELSAHQSKLSATTLEKEKLASNLAAQEETVETLTNRLRQRTTAFESESEEKQRLAEQVGQMQREMQKEKEANLLAAATAPKPVAKTLSTNAQVAELERYNADLNKMLKCTSCQLRYKTHVITRCYHLLCHECIEARLSNRQRKCPTCQMAFGLADVAQVFF